MKINLFILSLFSLLISSTFLVACKKKKETPTEEVTPTPTPEPPYIKVFTADIDGTAFTSTTTGGVKNMDYLIISGKTNSTTIQICTSALNNPGTYPLVTSLSLLIDSNVSYLGQSGSITILTHDKTKRQITGTFTLTAMSSTNVSKAITNGTFATTY
ncbi:MAG: DUF6252 family protein [Fluviicola sp.]|jgi:hypothetical protein|nr:DUF6252 family protein [Fluviicola sp.]